MEPNVTTPDTDALLAAAVATIENLLPWASSYAETQRTSRAIMYLLLLGKYIPADTTFAEMCGGPYGCQRY